MPRVMQPAFPQQAAAVHVAKPTAKAATRRMVKIGPMVLIACLVLAILAVLLIPMVVSGTAAVSSRAVAAPEAPALFHTFYDSAQAAAQALGLSDEVLAGLPADVRVTAASVVDDAYLELALTYGKDSYLYRAALGNNDLSGADYDAYTYTAAEDWKDATIGYAGVSEKKLSTAVWISGDHSYALVSENGADATEMRALVKAIV